MRKLILLLLLANLYLFSYGFVYHGKPATPSGCIIDTSIATKINHFYKMEAEYQHLSGAVLVMQKDLILYENAFGNANETMPNRLDTRFDIGSITKQFTAVAILKLVEEGKLKLHDNINPLLGKNASDKWKKVTIHQLLTHTSGIPSIYQTEQGIETFLPEEKSVELVYLIDKFKTGKLLFKPGEEFGYSNSGYVLLAAIIEHVTNTNYFEYLEQEVFEKYGLENTSFDRNPKAAQPFYGYRNDLIEAAPIYHRSWLIGGGGVYSTIGDLAKWTTIIQSEKVLNDRLREEYLKSHTMNGYGYGWQVDVKGRFQHDGGTAGFTSFLSIDPVNDIKVILLTNRSFKDIHMYGKSAKYVGGLAGKTWSILDGNPIEFLPERKHYTFPGGSFKSDTDQKVLIEAQTDTSIMVTTPGMQPTRLICNTILEGLNESEQKLISMANALEKKKYWKLAKYCEGEMSFVCFSGIMSIGMKIMKKQTGSVAEIIPFFVNEEYGIMRMKGEKGSLDLIAYFNEEGKAQGIFENGFSLPDRDIPMRAYVIGKGKFYLDGLPYGEESSFITIHDDHAIFEYKNREVLLSQVED